MFKRNLFFSISGVFILFAVCFSVYQYNREKEYKIDIMQSRLQMYSYEMRQSLGDSLTSAVPFYRYVKSHNLEGLRVTIINDSGKVLLDNRQRDVSKMSNHSDRAEVQQALQNGNGYDVKRASESTKETYFYSATLFRDIKINGKRQSIIIRAAVPYSAQLTESLRADNTYIYFALALTALLGIVLYYNTTRIGKHIGYLREFAKEAEEGKELDHQLERRLPDDELGEISHTIISLYWKLQHAEEDNMRIKRQLTQNAAHELKTPAASIHGYLESILSSPDMPADRRQHFLERCYAQSERMNKLLLDMAQLTKLETSTIPLKKKKNTSRNESSVNIDIIPIINNAFDDTALQLQKKGINVELSLPENAIVESPFEESDGISALYSVFRNLIDNTIAYATGATKIKLSIQHLVDDSLGHIECVFSDNGVGVEPQHLPHLFERFYRVDKGRSRKLGGTGLGLAIVKNTILTFGGTCSAEETPGGGLTIRFSINIQL